MKIGSVDFCWGSRTYVMGVLNVTPDSFSGDGTMQRGSDWVQISVDQGLRMEDEGADIIDVGGESSRPRSVYPDAAPVDEDVEMSRVLPVVTALSSRLSVPISIDSRKPGVTDAALAVGATVANDVSMLSDPDMAPIVAMHGAALVISHVRSRAEYVDVGREVADDLSRAVRKAREAGVDSDKVIVDPGIGFGKNARHSLEVLSRLSEVKRAVGGLPMLVGVSRKSFIGSLLNTDANDRFEGNAAATAMAIAGGADVVRVHEVWEMARVAKVVDAIARGWDVKRDEMSGIAG